MPSILWGWSAGRRGRALGGREARWCRPNPAPCGPAAAAVLPKRPGPLRPEMREAASRRCWEPESVWGPSGAPREERLPVSDAGGDGGRERSGEGRAVRSAAPRLPSLWAPGVSTLCGCPGSARQSQSPRFAWTGTELRAKALHGGGRIAGSGPIAAGLGMWRTGAGCRGSLCGRRCAGPHPPASNAELSRKD